MAPDHKLPLGSVLGAPGLPVDVLGDTVGAPAPGSAAWGEVPGSRTPWQGKPLLTISREATPRIQDKGKLPVGRSPGQLQTASCRWAHGLLHTGWCRGCPDFPWTCLGTGWSSNTQLCGPGGAPGSRTPQQGGPLLAIGREAPHSIRNTRKLPRAEFPTRQQLTSHRQAHGLWPCPR